MWGAACSCCQTSRPLGHGGDASGAWRGGNCQQSLCWKMAPLATRFASTLSCMLLAAPYQEWGENIVTNLKWWNATSNSFPLFAPSYFNRACIDYFCLVWFFKLKKALMQLIVFFLFLVHISNILEYYLLIFFFFLSPPLAHISLLPCSLDGLHFLSELKPLPPCASGG